MTYVKWTLIVVFWALVGAFLHYTLPQYDVARITDTYEKLIDFGENSLFWSQADSGTDATLNNRDVFFIQTRQGDGSVMVYRNEDTAWGWPPYFKFDTSNLQAEANDMRSGADAPVWVAIKHYGWRNEFLTIFPNAISVRVVEGPDVFIFSWTSLIILIAFFAVVWALWVRWRRFREARIDPVLEDIEEGLEATGDAIAERRGRFRRWLDSWKSK